MPKANTFKHGSHSHHQSSATYTTFIAKIYIHKHSFPLAVPAVTQSLVGWKTATAGTAVMPLPPSCANCLPSALYTSTNLFMLPIQSFWIPSWGFRCHCGRRLEVHNVRTHLDVSVRCKLTHIVTHLPVWLLCRTTTSGSILSSSNWYPAFQLLIASRPFVGFLVESIFTPTPKL